MQASASFGWKWTAAVALAVRAGQLHGHKQRVFKDPIYGWTWSCVHCAETRFW